MILLAKPALITLKVISGSIFIMFAKLTPNSCPVDNTNIFKHITNDTTIE
jgi:hypothetical protein